MKDAGRNMTDAQEEIRSFHALFASSPFGLIFYDASRGKVLLNKALSDIYASRDLEPMIWIELDRFAGRFDETSIDARRLMQDAERARSADDGNYSEVYHLDEEDAASPWISYMSRVILDLEGNIIGRLAMHTDVSPQMQVKSQRDLLSSSFAGSPAGLVLYDGRSQQVCFNQSFANLYPTRDVGPVQWVPVEKFSMAVVSEIVDTSHIIKDLERVSREDGETYRECFLLQKGVDGDSWVSYESMPIRDAEGTLIGRLAIHGDVSQQLLMEQELQELARLPEVNPLPVLRVNHEGIVQYYNPAARDFFEQAELEELKVGKPVADAIAERLPAAFSGRTSLGSVDIRLGGLYVRMLVAPFPENDQAFIHLEDVTKDREHHVQLHEANRKLEASNRELHENRAKMLQSEKMAALGTLVAGIAHEINNPVGSINSNNDIMYRVSQKIQQVMGELEEKDAGPGLQELKRALDVIDEINRVNKMACERIVDIVKSMKSFARLDEAEYKDADLHEGIDSTLTLLQHELKNKVEVVKDYGNIPSVESYPSQLNQVFMNILANAGQAIEGKGKITIRTRRKGDEFVEVDIEDSGKGIPKDQIDRIFEPGFTTKGVGVGSGLGLSISYKIIHDHGGEIRVQSEEGRGTTFTIRLPIVAPVANGDGRES